MVAGVTARAATTDMRPLRTIVTRATPGALLSASQVVPPSGSPASGTVTIEYPVAGALFSYHIEHNVAGETAAYIRRAPAGANGPIRLVLPLGSPKVGTWTTGWDATDASALASGALYVEVQSGAYPAGAIRGQFSVTSTGCSEPPVQGSPVCIKVVVQNLGPDPYIGTAPFARAQDLLPRAPAAGQLRIVVDIDEPTKPFKSGEPPRIAFSRTEYFAVTIAPGDSATLNFGEVNYLPPSGSTHTARATCYAQPPNLDPDLGNDVATTPFYVTAITPAVGSVALVLAALGLVLVAVRRQRARIRPRGH
jgi:hypothetical protein